MGLDRRIGDKFLNAGPGFGGSCFPKDVRALIKTAQDQEVSLRILEAVQTVNETRKRAMVRKISSAFSGMLRGKTVAILGLTFKPNTDDMREAPSIPLITALQDMGANVRAFDPAGMEQAKDVLADVIYCKGAYDCVEGADAAVIVTESGAISRIGFRAHEEADGASLDRRSEKHIPGRRYCSIWVRLHQCWARRASPVAGKRLRGSPGRL